MVRPRRCCLSVPAAARTLERGPGLAVDEVILDLEDSVPAERKREAREAVADAVAHRDWSARSVSVRINSLAGAWGADDVSALIEAGGDRLASLVVPKCEHPDQLAELDRLLGAVERRAGRSAPIALEALIETAAGLLNAGEIARCARLEALIVGPADLAASLGLPDLAEPAAGERLQPARWTVLVAARAAGIQAIDGPELRFDDPGQLRMAARRSQALGFDGKWAIHPAQVEAIESAFTPSAQELERAVAIVEALERGGERGALALGGEMIDEASRVRATALIARGEAAGLRP